MGALLDEKIHRFHLSSYGLVLLGRQMQATASIAGLPAPVEHGVRWSSQSGVADGASCLAPI